MNTVQVTRQKISFTPVKNINLVFDKDGIIVKGGSKNAFTSCLMGSIEKVWIHVLTENNQAEKDDCLATIDIKEDGTFDDTPAWSKKISERYNISDRAKARIWTRTREYLKHNSWARGFIKAQP